MLFLNRLRQSLCFGAWNHHDDPYAQRGSQKPLPAEQPAEPNEVEQTLPLPQECSVRYSVVRYLSKGASGFVMLVRDSADDELKAMKFVNRQNNKYILGEIVNQVRLKHPHVVKLEEILITSDFVILVMEYAEQGDLFSYLKQRKRFSEKRSRWYFQQLMFAIDFCHRVGIINRDIKLENLLLKGENKEILKIADFGLSKDENKSALTSSVGTVLYLAPELIEDFGNQQSYDGKKAEVWACGVVLYTMLTGFYPFVRKGERELGDVRLMNAILRRTVNLDYPALENVSSDASDLIKHMLDPDPSSRFGVEDVLHHPWFQNGLRFDVKKYNERVIRHLKEGGQDGLQEAIGNLLNAVEVWDSAVSLLESDVFEAGKAISDEEIVLAQNMAMNPVRLSDSTVVRFSNNATLHEDVCTIRGEYPTVDVLSEATHSSEVNNTAFGVQDCYELPYKAAPT
jgi:serine/threonine-protein kinase SRK2